VRLDPDPVVVGVAGADVEVQPVLRRLALGDLEEQQPGAALVRVDQRRGVVPALRRDALVGGPGLPGLEADRRGLLDVTEGDGLEPGQGTRIGGVEGDLHVQ
jgi:hypothetical protein